jgi:very-short-patch-repair endonuclease
VDDKSKQGYWHTSPELWEKLKPLAREKRRSPTPAEDRLWQRLRNRQIEGLKFRRQHPIDRFIVDFYCVEAALVIEVDGPIHEYSPEQDAVRQEFLESLGLWVLRFTNERVMDDLDGVVAEITAAATSPPVSQPSVASTSPSPVSEAAEMGGQRG